MMKTMYLMLTMMISDQTISERTPYTLEGIGWRPCLKHSRSAYRGLVPMSP